MDSIQWFVRGLAKSRWEVPLTEIVRGHGAADCIGVEHSIKFVVDGLDPELLHREK
jgi:hypothetical protein